MKVHHGDLFDVLPTIAAESIDACVTDPPYGIGFMGKEWDTFRPDVPRKQAERLIKGEPMVSDNPNINGRRRSPAISESQIFYDYSVEGLRRFQEWTEQWAREVFRVLKPGAYIVVCCAPRSYHRMACGLEDAGFVIRDKFAWLFGSGFPKNFNLGDGKGTALKPAHEPIALAWKPFKGSITACHEKHGTGALNIDACRINPGEMVRGGGNGQGHNGGRFGAHETNGERPIVEPHDSGRWPANVIIDDVAAAAIDEQTGELSSGRWPSARTATKFDGVYESGFAGQLELSQREANIGGASRFYYCAKPSREERDMGCYDLEPRQRDESRKRGNPGGDNPRNRGLHPRGNYHPTVKPIALMRWLVKLVTPLSGKVIDPFGGSGTTACACVYEHRDFVIIEREAEYIDLITRRVAAVAPLFTEAT